MLPRAPNPAYFRAAVQAPSDLAELISETAAECGATGAEIQDAADWDTRDPGIAGGLPAPPPDLVPGTATVVAYFTARAQAQAYITRLRKHPGLARMGAGSWPAGVAKIRAQDWTAAYRDSVQPLRVEDLAIVPPWLAREAIPPYLIMEHGLASGTGEHETTQLCLRALRRALARHPRAAVLDVGCGTGILGFAALRWGAQKVLALDTDPIAVGVAQRLAKLNGFGAELTIRHGPLSSVHRKYAVVVANLVLPVLADLAQALRRRLRQHGTLIVSGFLETEVTLAKRPFGASGGWSRTGASQLNGWGCLSFTQGERP